MTKDSIAAVGLGVLVELWQARYKMRLAFSSPVNSGPQSCILRSSVAGRGPWLCHRHLSSAEPRATDLDLVL